jgi:hypothetical protein
MGCFGMECREQEQKLPKMYSDFQYVQFWVSENKINKEWRAHMFSDIQSELIYVMTIITEKYSSSDASTLINVFQNQRQ